MGPGNEAPVKQESLEDVQTHSISSQPRLQGAQGAVTMAAQGSCEGECHGCCLSKPIQGHELPCRSFFGCRLDAPGPLPLQHVCPVMTTLNGAVASGTNAFE